MLVTDNACTLVEASTSFADALLITKSLGLERKKTKMEKKKEKREVEKAITKKVNEHFAEKAAIPLLVEGESKRKYHRKRLAQSFCSPGDEQPAQKRKKTHSPNFEHVTWDTSQLEVTLHNWAMGTLINWTNVARERGFQVRCKRHIFLLCTCASFGGCFRNFLCRRGLSSLRYRPIGIWMPQPYSTDLRWRIV
ncbi:MAG: hypothetical protein A6F71_09280 [Cycloclasticus sp. symbiont of Poecilosclerida sp. M]|nr:MAG: hypothetical protein A6F71_09280 [Cycloclasticus sp. symbiont of Poecilosclerida sp. M]